ncbi:MAG TPA: DUF459 domain-containing protein [Spirochaetota bacterium]|nr:DUF459 domain-containing protein [Spirochaetota bacterium]HOS33220.1 DUF459 domain-containing protein [Spirochaetota bacterium]HOS56464.1 DUF459 domain-containing protein [Spirochaetota bacterium]HPK61424.1 DUF459 domain-containing protein [Spirochaetota bacterium]HQF78815.1 DUF459 domain-containing protein [Spirochaetota bacterium]
MKKYKLIDVYLILFIIIVIALTFNSKALYQWAERLDIGRFRTAAMKILSPINQFSEKLGFGIPYSVVREKFLKYSGVEEVSPEVVEDLSYSQDASDDKTYFSRENKLKILLLGDSMMKEAFSSMINASLANNNSIYTYTLANYSSGLSRPDFFNWPLETEKLLSEYRFDLAICILGMNDAQDIEENGIKYFVNSENWNNIYRERAEKFVSLLSENITKVYWLGVPIMRDDRYNKRMLKLNQIFSDVCKNFANVKFFDISQKLSDAGRYTDYLKIDGVLVKIRLSDGKHVTYEGAKIITQDLIRNISLDFTFEFDGNDDKQKRTNIIYY